MKEFLFTVFGCMVLSCLFNSVGIWMDILPNYPEYPIGTRVDEMKEGPTGLSREDMSFPEIGITNQIKENGFIIRIDDKGERGASEFPFSANN